MAESNYPPFAEPCESACGRQRWHSRAGSVDPFQLVALCAASFAFVTGGYLALAPLVTSQLDVAGISGVPGVFLGIVAIITAIATGIIQPYLRQKNTEGLYAQAVREILSLKERLDEWEVRNDSWTSERDGLLKNLTDLTNKNLQLTAAIGKIADKNLTLIRTMLVRSDRHPEHEPMPPDLLISDGVPDPSGPLVLVVEDDQYAREAIRQILERKNFRVEICSNVADALVALDHDPAFVLLDLMLPGGDGVEVLRQVRNTGGRAKVIVTTGKDDDSLAEVRSLGPLALFKKPLRLFTDVMPLLSPTP